MKLTTKTPMFTTTLPTTTDQIDQLRRDVLALLTALRELDIPGVLDGSATMIELAVQLLTAAGEALVDADRDERIAVAANLRVSREDFERHVTALRGSAKASSSIDAQMKRAIERI